MTRIMILRVDCVDEAGIIIHIKTSPHKWKPQSFVVGCSIYCSEYSGFWEH